MSLKGNINRKTRIALNKSLKDLAILLKCCRKNAVGVNNMIDRGRRGRKPGYIHEMGSHDLKSYEVKCHVTLNI